MNAFMAICYRFLGPLAERKVEPALQARLQRAHMTLRASAFLAALWVASALVGLWGALMALVVMLALHAHPLFLVLVPLLAATLLTGWAYVLGPMWLQNRASELEKQIDEALPAALNYMLALANAGLPPAQIWGSLARAKAFGPLAFEAERIQRDLVLFSHDILTALRNAQERTPSKRLHEFLQGAISSFQSGVELEDYLKSKGQQYHHQSLQEQAQAIDTMGVMAEAFLVVVVAAPLFLMILLSVMAISQGRQVIAYGLALSLLFLPLAQVIVGTMIQSMNPKSWS